MKKLNDIGQLKIGMVLVDKNGLEGKITGFMGLESDAVWVEVDGDKDRMLMWDWDRVRDDVYVREGTY